MKKAFFSVLMLLFFSNIYSQVKSSQELKNAGYNTPPGLVFGKIDPNFSYADKLNFVPNEVPADYHEPKMMGDKSLEQFLSDQNLSQENRTYYQEAKIYFDALSPKVKTLFTPEELWHIYYFDAVLKEKLKTIN